MKLMQQTYHSDCLAEAARNLLPTTVAVATADSRMDYTMRHPPLHALELPALTKMSAPRRCEYSAGRHAARNALAQFATYQKPIIQGQDRAPIWPTGFTGSISHTNEHCIAVVAKTNDLNSIGVDIEPNSDLDQQIISEICGSNELSWINAQPLTQRGKLARLIFSAKECAYKCQYPLTHQIFGFDTFHITINQTTSCFTATFEHPIEIFHKGYQLSGRYCIVQDTILTTVFMPKPLIPGNVEL
jgi:4'-phosphopantetheinyl transferase EntD